MVTVVLIGAGNVASHLAKTFIHSNEINLVQVYNRSSKNLQQFEHKVNTTTYLNKLAKADVYIIAIPDDEIASFSEKLPKLQALVVHTSGSLPLNSLSKKNSSGVFYPLQTFTKNKDVNFKEIPICIEAENEADLNLLQNLASSISDKVYKIDSEQRKQLHLAAVFVNNFSNHLYYIADKICKKHKIPFDILKPLLLETAKKTLDLSPYEAQTGPAKRNDKKTINAHLELLNTEQKAIYKQLTDSIIKTYGKKL